MFATAVLAHVTRLTTHLVQHRSPNGQRNSGFAVAIDGARTHYVRLCADDTWCWTASHDEAELFLTEVAAERWAARNIGGGQPRVVGVMR